MSGLWNINQIKFYSLFKAVSNKIDSEVKTKKKTIIIVKGVLKAHIRNWLTEDLFWCTFYNLLKTCCFINSHWTETRNRNRLISLKFNWGHTLKMKRSFNFLFSCIFIIYLWSVYFLNEYRSHMIYRQTRIGRRTFNVLNGGQKWKPFAATLQKQPY